ncbi:putative reverse transcriptase domain-containing protein [Tanacetum coccineum]|uniref:Reverse transcriptase domain-containing protein n=1 Tax=Tanacetum coccineum TaxID=301880 RepID=A0ABQ5HUT5_9ASTR
MECPCQSSQIMIEHLLQGFWQILHKALGTRLDMSMACHPQTDGQTQFSYNNSYHSSIRCAPFEALYGRKCRLSILWAEIRESRLIGLELVQETTDKVILIKERLKAARDCQNSYVGNRRKQLGFKVGDKVILEVSSWKVYLMCFNLKKYLADANLHVHLEEIKVDKTLCFVEEPVEIINREVKSLKHSRIPIVKVHWNSKRGYEDFIKTKYPHLLVEQAIVGSTK